ncbi:MAG: PIN domain-containing protein [Propionibacteriaceae bacterium]|jgi:toxin-antitoxin system PIN domain toxin|nr:PIN domain-containing protein [Propionibacteriaceae bacterium]
MKTELADVNVLVAIAIQEHADHQAAVDWLRGVEQFATTPVTEMGLLRLLLNPVIIGVGITEALDTLRSIKDRPTARFWPDATSLTDRRAVTAHVTGSKQITDTHLLNLAIAHGGRLTTFDKDFLGGLPLKFHSYVRLLNPDQ